MSVSGTFAMSLDEMDQTMRQLTGQVETLQHDLEAERKANADDDAALTARVDKLEQQLAPAPPPGAAGGAPPAISRRTRDPMPHR